jgi:DHA2 family multidrug resistance protein
MIGFGYFVLAIAMWNFSTFDLATDYRHFALARALQGLGIAPLFVPVSQLAYSYLPKNKNNKASSLTNLFRNQGGSFGIAFVTTMLERRTQFHQTVLAEHANPVYPAYREKFAAILRYFEAHGFSAADAAIHAKAQVAQLVGQQAAFFGFLDCFRLLACVAFLGVPMVFFVKKFGTAGGGGAVH